MTYKGKKRPAIVALTPPASAGLVLTSAQARTFAEALRLDIGGIREQLTEIERHAREVEAGGDQRRHLAACFGESVVLVTDAATFSDSLRVWLTGQSE